MLPEDHSDYRDDPIIPINTGKPGLVDWICTDGEERVLFLSTGEAVVEHFWDPGWEVICVVSNSWHVVLGDFEADPDLLKAACPGLELVEQAAKPIAGTALSWSLRPNARGRFWWNRTWRTATKVDPPRPIKEMREE